VSPFASSRGHFDAQGYQAAKDVAASQETLIEVFERVENFIRRLKTYVNVPHTEAMTDIIVKIMVEVLSILAIATKEIERGKASEYFLWWRLSLSLGSATLEKYLNNLMGRSDMKDALGRLDKLTQDEIGTVAAQVLKTVHGVDERVNVVLESAHAVFKRSMRTILIFDTIVIKHIATKFADQDRMLTLNIAVVDNGGWQALYRQPAAREA
jgi:hypothetical protein